MKKLYVFLTALALCTLVLTGCNASAKQFGGTMEIALPENQKLVEATWKDSDLWYLTKPMKDTDVAEEYTFQEDSNLGVFEGKVIFKEYKKESTLPQTTDQNIKASKSEMNSTTQK